MNETNLETADLDAVADTLSDGASAVASVASAAPVVAAVRAPRKGAGRKLDVTGTTNLGKARILHAANPNLSVKELKQKIESELKVTPNVAQTYASLVRKPKPVAA